MSLRKLAVVAAVSLAGYGGSLTAAGAESLKIGIIAPLTGPGAPWGIAMAQGAKILAARQNAQGGLEVGGKKYQLEMIAYDDQYKTQEAVSAYIRLVNQDGVKYVAFTTGGATMAVKQNLESDKVIGLSAGFSPQAVDAKTKYVYRAYGIYVDYFPALYAWLKANKPERRVAIMNPNDETARDMGVLAEKLLKQNGYEVLTNEVYERAQKDFAPLLTKIIASKPELIDLGGSPPNTAALVIRQAREFGYKGPFLIAVPGWKEVVSAVGNEAAEGIITVLYADPTNDGYRQLAAEYKKAIGQDPNESIAAYYDGINVMVRAIQLSGDVNDTSKFEAAFARALPMDSVQGEKMTLGGKDLYGVDHQPNIVRFIGTIKNGEPVIAGKIK